MIYSILIIIVLFLIISQIYMEYSKPYLLEGLDNNVTYTEYASNNTSQDALILAQQNAGNIEFLKQQVDSLLGLQTQVNTLSNEMDTMSSQINDLGQQIADYGTAVAGSEPLTVSGTDYTSPTTDTTATTTTTDSGVTTTTQ